MTVKESLSDGDLTKSGNAYKYFHNHHRCIDCDSFKVYFWYHTERNDGCMRRVEELSCNSCGLVITRRLI